MARKCKTQQNSNKLVSTALVSIALVSIAIVMMGNGTVGALIKAPLQ